MKKGLKAIHYTCCIFLLLSGMIICLTGCGEQGPSVSISASPGIINYDESTILTWSSHDADSVSINNGVGTVDERGTTEVKPRRTTTYTISGVNADGKAKSSVTVKVKYAGPEPVINVSADPTTIFPGETSVLTWSTTNADILTIDNGIGSVSLDYSMTVSPTDTTTYTFIAIGPGGETMSQVTITVIHPPTAEITANPANIKLGEVSVLKWNYTNADTVTIDPIIGDGTQTSSAEVSPSTDTTYTIIATGPGGTVTDCATILVGPPIPIYVDIDATPKNIHLGDSSVLTWTSQNATRVWIEQLDNGDVNLTGTYTVTPKKTTTYVIHASNNGREVQASVTIIVLLPDPPNVSITANPSKIKPSETAILAWESQNAKTVEIDQGIGFVSLSGSKAVTPLETTTYTIQAKGSGGSNSASVTVYVASKVPLGNQQFIPENAIQIDPLAPYRLNFELSSDTDRLLIEKMDWSHKIPAVQNQETTASDNAWVMAYYLRSFQESISKQHLVHETMFSPMYTYVLQCQNETEPWNLIKAWKMIHRYGCAIWTSLPFEDLDGFMDETEIAAYGSYQLNDSLISKAIDYRIGTPVMLTDLDQIRMMLTQSPIVLAINHFDPELPASPTTNDQNFIKYSDQSDVGHTVLCIGYDNKQFNTGALKIVNSWGSEWAQDGMSWIKYTDLNKIVVSAMAFNALTNKTKEMTYETKKPEKPKDVQATNDTGPFVDIQWKHAPNSRYYKIYRAPASSLSTMHEVYDYECIGTAMHSPYRDFPAAGDAYLYAIVAVNEFGSSEHLDHQDDKEPHISTGRSSGKPMKTPALSFEASPSAGQSEFSLLSLETNTSRLQVMVSHSEYGPWQSFGWIKPLNRFIIDWYRDNSWTGYQPYVRVVAENQSDGFSMASGPVQVPTAIIPQNQVATIDNLNAQATDLQNIQLVWSLTGDKIDFLDIWRTHDIQTSSPTWIKLDTVSALLDSYHDASAVKGINYQYEVHCVYEGISGIGQKSNIIQLPLDKPNLKIVHVEYDTGALMEPFEMELTVENNGNSTIQDYTFTVMAYNWASDDFEVCLEKNTSNYPEIKKPMDPGSTHIFSITFDLPEQLNSGVLFSWYIMIDSTYAIDEFYESDNVYWAQKMCWMEMEQ